MFQLEHLKFHLLVGFQIFLFVQVLDLTRLLQKSEFLHFFFTLSLIIGGNQCFPEV